jgi:predicted HicB family RNase H-like nuclease
MKETKKKDTTYLMDNQHAKLPLDKALSATLKVRCNSPELQRWKDKAAKSGQSCSRWVRLKLNED